MVPEASLVLGVPGRVVRTMRDDEIERVRDNARTYVDLARAYRNGEIPMPMAQS